MGLGNFLQYIDQQSQRSALADFASKKYGADSPQAALAANAPDLFAQGLAKQMFDPSAQAEKVKMQALMGLIGGDTREQQPQIGANEIRWNSERLDPSNFYQQGKAPPQRQASFLPPVGMVPHQALALEQSQLMEQDSQSGLDKKQLALLALLNPDKAIDYIIDQNDPERKLKIQKEKQALITDKKKEEESIKANQLKKESALRDLDRLLGSKEQIGIIDRAISQVDPWTTSQGGIISRFFAGPQSKDLEQNISTIQSNTALQTLMDLKSSSPTGASGLGALSEKELELLTTKMRSLNPEQSPEQVKRNLLEIFAELKTMRDKISVDMPQTSNEQKIIRNAKGPDGKIVPMALQNGQWVPMR